MPELKMGGTPKVEGGRASIGKPPTSSKPTSPKINKLTNFLKNGIA
jgi:hypothetical protein